ncbi:MAG: aminotransferase class I/II-fold pyridoxal phosphate-dependent enzyme, partial [Bacteriovoracaceae bacterium]
MISSRAKALLNNPSPIVVGHVKCQQDPFGPNNPKGCLNFGIAENRLIDDLALKVLDREVEGSKESIHYPPVHGLLELRKAFAAFAKEFLNAGNLNPEHIAVQSGVSSVCEALSFCLFEEGDELIVPAPFYSGFSFDFEARFKVKLVSVQLKNFEHYIQAIKEAVTSKTKG